MQKLDILQGDLSVNNILIRRIPAAHLPPGVGNFRSSITCHLNDQTYISFGFLIDFDYAFSVNNESSKLELHKRSGTVPYMALECLNNSISSNTFTHSYRHDLESLLYTALVIMVYTVGPSTLLKPVGDGPLIAEWFTKTTPDGVYKSKIGLLSALDLLYKPDLPSYWDDAYIHIKELVLCCWPQSHLGEPNCAEYEDFLHILRDGAKKVQEPSGILSPRYPAQYIVLNKRRLGNENEYLRESKRRRPRLGRIVDIL